MLNLKGPDGDLGVVIARFQTPYLTEGHRALIETVRARHKKFAIVLGVSRVIPSRKNPLDYATRYGMIQEAYPGTEIYPLSDYRSDEIWSQNLDGMLRGFHPHEKLVLYGGRDSFIKHYTGKFPTVELDSEFSESGTMARSAAFHELKRTEDFRRGVCYATANQYRKNVLCVDVAVVDKGKLFRVLLGRKPDDPIGQWRFFGGHVNVGKETLEQAGKREVAEESGVTLGTMEYVGSTPIQDWRYEGTGDSIFTVFFVGHYFFGPVQAGDDISEVNWFDLVKITENMIVEEHRGLFNMLLQKYALRGSENHGIETSEYTETEKYDYEYRNGRKVYISPVPAEKVKWD